MNLQFTVCMADNHMTVLTLSSFANHSVKMHQDDALFFHQEIFFKSII